MPSSPNGPVIFLLRGKANRDEFQRVAELYKWILVHEEAGDGRVKAYEQVRSTGDSKTSIHFVDDPAAEQRFLLVYGDQTRDAAFNIGRSFDIETSDDVLKRARQAASDQQKVEAAWQLGVVFPGFDAEALAVLSGYYAHGADSVRRAVIGALGYHGWPEADSFLESAAHGDPNPELRALARRVFDSWASQREGD